MKLVKIKDVILNKISGEWGEEADESNSTPVIRTANFRNNGKVDFDNLVFRNIPTHKINAKRLIDGDVIIEKSGGSPTQPVGRVVFFANSFGKTFLCNNFTSILRPDKELVFPEFLFYVLFYNHKMGKTLRFQNKTTGIINLQLDKYLESEIPLPSLAEQIQIATVLSKAEDLIAKRKEGIELLDEFVKSTFLEMFGDPVRNEKGWDKKTLKSFGQIITGNTPPRGDLENYSDNFIEWIKTDNIISSETYISKASEYLSEKGLKKARTVTVGALLVACIAGSVESIGRSAIADRTVSFNQQINAIQPSNEVNSLFLYWLFKISKYYIQNQATKGMKKILTKGIFEKIIMIKPPTKLQNQFAEIANKVEVLKAKYQKSLEELENLYGSLSQRAFRGEL
ncbi:MAG TPA: restriction endonuclease subunit S [bacterium]|nr:restriction endonuclease subunit S [bacterium]